jgi:hypothetical protein
MPRIPVPAIAPVMIKSLINKLVIMFKIRQKLN